jgi:hypothetical protein
MEEILGLLVKTLPRFEARAQEEIGQEKGLSGGDLDSDCRYFSGRLPFFAERSGNFGETIHTHIHFWVLE